MTVSVFLAFFFCKCSTHTQMKSRTLIKEKMSQFSNKTFIYDVWRHQMKLPRVNLTLKGHSRGGERSGFFIPEVGVCFDAGLNTDFSPQSILITHCHSDHSFCLPMMLTGVDPPPLVCCPKEHVHLFENFVQAKRLLSSAGRNHWRNSFLGVKPGDTVPLGNSYFAQVFRLIHSVPTVGYGLCNQRAKLKPEFLGKPGKELAALRQSGVEISDTITVPLVAYLCDTTTDVFAFHPELLDYPVVLVECTFLGDDVLETASKSRHTHWNDLKPIIASHPNTHFVLIHFSMRYSLEDLDQFFSGDNSLPNITVWKN